MQKGEKAYIYSLNNKKNNNKVYKVMGWNKIRLTTLLEEEKHLYLYILISFVN